MSFVLWIDSRAQEALAKYNCPLAAIFKAAEFLNFKTQNVKFKS